MTHDCQCIAVFQEAEVEVPRIACTVHTAKIAVGEKRVFDSRAKDLMDRDLRRVTADG